MRKLFFLMALMVGSAQAADVKITWEAPPACADGSPISNCPTTGYELAEQISDGAWTVKQGYSATTLTATVTGVPAGQKRCYRLRTNASGTFSANSNAACITVPVPAPGAPINVTVTVTVSIP